MDVNHRRSQEFADKIVGTPHGVEVSKGRTFEAMYRSLFRKPYRPDFLRPYELTNKDME